MLIAWAALLAEYRAGELLKEMAKNGQRQQRGGDRKSKSASATLIPELEDLGITKDQSSDWQRLRAWYTRGHEV